MPCDEVAYVSLHVTVGIQGGTPTAAAGHRTHLKQVDKKKYEQNKKRALATRGKLYNLNRDCQSKKRLLLV